MAHYQQQAAESEAALLPQLRLDDEGFLADPYEWSEGVARIIAHLDGIGPLNDAHWRVIGFVRDRYLRLGAMPPMRRICRSSQLDRQQVKALFGGCLQVWRVAGLPYPGEEARSYMA